MNLLLTLQILIVLAGIYFLVMWVIDLVKNKDNLGDDSPVKGFIIGFITDVLDTIGIGSFAPTTMLFQVTKFLKAGDKQLPGTLNVAHTIPVITEALLFLVAVKVEPVTLFSLVIAAVVGAMIGARVINKFSEKKIQIMMGYALIITAILMAAKQLGWIDLLGKGNTAIGLTGIALIVAIVINFFLGALMMAGIGLYAPCMAMVFILGLNPLVAFPIMMASCAGLMAMGSPAFIKEGNYSRRGSIAVMIGGVIGVFVAVKFVTNVDITILTWIIIVVVLYTAVTMLIKGHKKAEKKAA